MGHDRDLVADAKVLLRQRRYQAVVQMLAPEMDDRPDDARAWETLAAACFALEQWEQAERAAGHVVRLRPDSVRAWCNWGMVLRKVGRLQEARDAQRQALEMDPRSTRARRELRRIGEIEWAQAEERDAGVLHVELEPAPPPPDAPGPDDTAPTDTDVSDEAELDDGPHATGGAPVPTPPAKPGDPSASAPSPEPARDAPGLCPGCGSRDLSRAVRTEEPGTARAPGFASRLLRLLPFLGRRTTYQVCNDCGRRWRA